ncbi:MAG: hypothetical protein QF603_21635 [Alphaproteobacteria bacterium]|nr:hypothetical protein [Alphaproteobacteria bacterium]
MPIVTDLKLSLGTRDITERHRPLCRDGLHPRLAKKVTKVLAEVEELELLNPAIAYQAWPVDRIKGKRLHLASGEVFEDAPVLAHRLGKPAELIALVCTIGSRLDSQIDIWFAEHRASDAVVLAEIGIAALGALRDDALALVAEDVKSRGLGASGALSPGDAGFSLDGQELLLRLAGARGIGVEMGSTAMMSPAKTLSMVAGLGTDMPKWSHADACERCEARDNCRYRAAEKESVPA